MASWNKILIEAACDGSLTDLKLSIENGADLECRDGDSLTPLLNSVYYGHMETVQYLVSVGCNKEARSKDMGVSVTRSVVEKIMDFMDTDNSGAIDLGEFLEGDRRIRKMSRDFARSSRQQIKREYNKYSRSFTRAHIDPMTFQLKIQEPKQLLPPIQSREPSISPVMR
ncbi:Hypothetical predicted protein [Mytilus galloprovincialis]|uniref:EF-hand domain-containing protein n=1 Tax=Mytilus galloprovincialis TaxID=29158 RepID=A0A8B6F6U9_MYTGA|nr:Hypothetical predicted protein [Mytilus galloprovincialis]